MDNKDKIITEMAKDIKDILLLHFDKTILFPYLAQDLYSKNYRKINDNEVVISKEEYKNFKKELLKAHHKGCQAGFDMTKFKEYAIRFATARDIYEQLKGHGTTYVKKWIKDKYGVENNDIVINKERNKKPLKEMYEQGKFDALADLDKDGKVVISKEELDLYRHNLEHLETVCSKLEKQVKEESKETAEKIFVEVLDLEELKVILDMGWEKTHNSIINEILELAKEFGVEIGEEK